MKTLTLLCLLFISSNALAKEHIVEIYKMKFNPAEIVIKKGDTIIWRNIEKRQYHNIWFKQLQKEEPDYLFPDESYQRSFDQAGHFSYECGPHPRMKGVVIVKVDNKKN